MPTSDRCAAAILVRTLQGLSVGPVFALSGNQIMPIFDAVLDTGIRLIHVRHEAAAVHMADAWGRLSGRPGVALVTAGPGFANTLSALYVARMAESPLVLLSGDSPTTQHTAGPFQQLDQVGMAQHVTKESWRIETADSLEASLARAFRLSTAGRPGPIHLALPSNVLAELRASSGGAAAAGYGELASVSHPPQFRQFVDRLAAASRPLVLVGPQWMRAPWRGGISRFEQATGVPVIGMESPRGLKDPSLGRVASVVARSDVVLLLGKRLDFTLRTAGKLGFNATATLLQIDADREVLELSRRVLGEGGIEQVEADPAEFLRQVYREPCVANHDPTWRREVTTETNYRPEHWGELNSGRAGALHPASVCREIQAFLSEQEESLFVSDGGEFGQWAQACIRATERIINGPSGSIGSVIPAAIAARLARPHSQILATCGDGTFGFHALEFDTAVRHRLALIVVVGNDARWNAEYQIQVRDYGADRAIGCELLPTRYDQLVNALGGHGEHVETLGQLRPALTRAARSGLPACVNVTLASVPAPEYAAD